MEAVCVCMCVYLFTFQFLSLLISNQMLNKLFLNSFCLCVEQLRPSEKYFKPASSVCGEDGLALEI